LPGRGYCKAQGTKRRLCPRVRRHLEQEPGKPSHSNHGPPRGPQPETQIHAGETRWSPSTLLYADPQSKHKHSTQAQTTPRKQQNHRKQRTSPNPRKHPASKNKPPNHENPETQAHNIVKYAVACHGCTPGSLPVCTGCAPVAWCLGLAPLVLEHVLGWTACF
jgi:hypothetical protein